MLIGYMRPYVEDEHCDRQMKQLHNLKCEIIVQEEHAYAKRRTKLKSMMASLNSGDKVVVARLFTFADSTRHLMELLEALEAKNAYLYTIHEKIDTATTMGARFKETVKQLLEFQSDAISQKTKNGLYEAKQKGHSAGRPRKPDENVQRAILMYQSKSYTLAEIKEATGISKSTLYRYLEQ
ncbi:recombinase family protein [Paenibacillus apiarius]|uniref:recombinase family protein n=1 Tax=Paenibacillus apiarius TaxID=46240 RepID=UPI003B3AA29E